MVEYAIVAALMVGVAIVISGLAEPNLFVAWLEEIKRAIFVSANNLRDISTVWSQVK
jgi:hypothetical protein